MKINEIINEDTNEGWKGALAGAALIGAVGAGMVASNPMTIGDVTYQHSIGEPESKGEIASSQIITRNGKKYLVWKGEGNRPNKRAWCYKEIKPKDKKTNNLGFNKEKWKGPGEIEPTDLWIN